LVEGVRDHGEFSHWLRPVERPAAKSEHRRAAGIEREQQREHDVREPKQASQMQFTPSVQLDKISCETQY
jgi:hypothetical protein